MNRSPNLEKIKWYLVFLIVIENAGVCNLSNLFLLRVERLELFLKLFPFEFVTMNKTKGSEKAVTRKSFCLFGRLLTTISLTLIPRA